MLGALVLALPSLVTYCTLTHSALSRRVRKILRNKYRYATRVTYVPQTRRFSFALRLLRSFVNFGSGGNYSSRLQGLLVSWFGVLGQTESLKEIYEVGGAGPTHSGVAKEWAPGWYMLRAGAIRQKLALSKLVVQGNTRLLEKN
jgi:hypothetical protein